jgi:hypothetical protein
MSDRTESLLAELVELQKRNLANQEIAIARQQESIVLQSGAIERQKAALKRIWLLIAFVILAIVGLPLLSWLAVVARR